MFQAVNTQKLLIDPFSILLYGCMSVRLSKIREGGNNEGSSQIQGGGCDQGIDGNL